MFKFHNLRSKRSRVIVFTDTQTATQTARHTDRHAGILCRCDDESLLQKSRTRFSEKSVIAFK